MPTRWLAKDLENAMSEPAAASMFAIDLMQYEHGYARHRRRWPPQTRATRRAGRGTRGLGYVKVKSTDRMLSQFGIHVKQVQG
jgi:hypothetical protein